MIKEGYLNLSEEKLEVAIFNCEHYESMQEYLKEIVLKNQRVFGNLKTHSVFLSMGIEIMRLYINMRTDGNPNGYENFPITLKIEKV